MTSETAGYRRLRDLMAMLAGDEGHSSSATSTLDILWVLYDRVLRISPETVDDPERDRFLLSKGHGPMAYYAVLAAKGFVPVQALRSFATFESPLGGHPDRSLLPGVEISSGSLGLGLGLGVGMALGLRIQGRTRPRVVVMVGDAELDEGSNHEAIHYAGAAGLDSLTCVVIDNRSRTHQLIGGLAGVFTAAGWEVRETSGRDHDRSAAALATPAGRPLAVVAHVESKQE
jgi:transketolase